MHARMTPIYLSVLIPLVAAIPAAPDATSQPEAPQGSAASRAYVDPVTGKLTQGPLPGAAIRSLPTPSLQPDNSKLEVVHHPNGAIQVKFHGQRQATVYATLATDGTVQTHCVEDTAELGAGSQSVDKPHE